MIFFLVTSFLLKFFLNDHQERHFIWPMSFVFKVDLIFGLKTEAHFFQVKKAKKKTTYDYYILTTLKIIIICFCFVVVTKRPERRNLSCVRRLFIIKKSFFVGCQFTTNTWIKYWPRRKKKITSSLLWKSS